MQNLGLPPPPAIPSPPSGDFDASDGGADSEVQDAIGLAQKLGELRLRKLFRFVVAFGAIAAAFGINVARTLPGNPELDVLIQSVFALALALIAAWTFLNPRRDVRRAALALISVAAVALAARLMLMLYGPNSGLLSIGILPPFMSWVPMLFLIAYCFLPQRLAFQLSAGFYLVSAAGVTVFALLNWSSVPTTFAIQALVQQFVIGHLLYIALIEGGAQLLLNHHADVRAASDARTLERARAEVDPVTALLNRHGLQQKMRERARNPKDRFIVLGIRVANLELQMDLNADHIQIQVADILRQQLRQAFAVGRWETGQFYALYPQQYGAIASINATHVRQSLVRVLGDESMPTGAVVVRRLDGESADDLAHRLGREGQQTFSGEGRLRVAV